MRAPAFCVVAMLWLSACAGGPRPHTPVVAATPADVADYQAALEACRAHLDRPDAVVTGALTVAGGAAATYTVGGVAFAAGAAGSGGSLATAAGAAGAAMVVALPLSIYLVSRVNRSRQERRIQRDMETCMAERGYRIVGWHRAAAPE